MKTPLKQLTAFIIVFVMLLGCVPTFAEGTFPEKSASESEYSVEAMTDENEDFWKSLEKKELKLKEEKSSPEEYIKYAYKLVSEQDNIKNLCYIDSDTFKFTLSKGVTCIYDYELRMIELENLGKEPQGEIIVNDYSTKSSAHTTQCKSTVVFGPYYGYDNSFTDFYKNLGNEIAQAKGGTATILSGSQATPAAVRQYLQQADNAAVFFDSHGITDASSYIGVYGSTGLTSSDLTSQHAIALSGGTHYAIDGYYMTNMGTYDISDCFIWMAACESMMTYGLGYPLRFSGAAVVLGYSQSISFTQDYNWSGTFWDNMLAGKTVAEAAAAMKAAHGVSDPYGGVNAYPVFMSATDAYPSNPDATQNVTSTWKLINNDPLYTVTFVDYDGTVINTQKVYKNEDAVAPSNPSRYGYTFTGWNSTYTNVQGNLTITAQYQINTYTVKFLNWDGSTLSTQEVNHGSAATAPADPSRTNYTFAGWDTDFTSITANTTITALFNKEICEVTFKDWDGTVLSSQNVNYGNAAAAPDVSERIGYQFVGWDKEFSSVTDDMVITALYKIKTFTVTFYAYDGVTVLKTQTVNYNSYAVPPTAPTRVGYTFKEWSGSYSNVTADVSVTAIYQKNIYKVVFADWNGVTLSTQDIEHGSSATPPADPTRAGYRFTGWSGSYTNVTANLTLVAQYEEYVEPQFTVESTFGRANNNVTVNIVLSHNHGLKETGLTFAYDTTVLELVSVTNGTVMQNMTQNGTTLTWTSTSPNAATGTICTIVFKIKSGITTGTVANISLTAGTSTDSNDNEVTIATVNGTVTVNNFLLGDVNIDGQINTADAVLILRYISGQSVNIDTEAADINGSGRVTTADAMYLMKYLAGDNTDGYFPA